MSDDGIVAGTEFCGTLCDGLAAQGGLEKDTAMTKFPNTLEPTACTVSRTVVPKPIPKETTGEAVILQGRMHKGGVLMSPFKPCLG